MLQSNNAAQNLGLIAWDGTNKFVRDISTHLEFTFVFEVTLLAAPWADRGLPRAQTALDAYLDDTGTYSVHAALRGDVTLGGVAHTSDLAGFTNYGAVEVNGAEYLGCVLTVNVWA